MIIADKRVQRIIGIEYGIHQSHVSAIKRGDRWPHMQTSTFNGETNELKAVEMVK